VKIIKNREGFSIYGKVVDEVTGRGIPNLKVKAFDKDLFFDDLLGEVTTGMDGTFEIVYDQDDFQELFFDNKPDIYIKVKAGDGEEIFTTKEKVRYGAGKTEEFLVRLPADRYVHPVSKFEVSVLRPEDMLTLDFRFLNLKLEDKKLVVLDKNVPAYMVVEFPPQNIAEEAFFETAVAFPVKVPEGSAPARLGVEDPDEGRSDNDPLYYPCKSRISETSRLVFTVPKDAEIEYSTEGLLEACSKFSLNVAPTAAPPLLFLMTDIKVHDLLQRVEMLKHIDPVNITLKQANTGMAKKNLPVHSDDASSIIIARAQKWSARTTMKQYLPQIYDDAVRVQIAQSFWETTLMVMKPPLQKPTGLETSIEAPFRLIISPNKYAAWAHTSQPVISPSTKRYELWHTRYALRLGNKINEEDHRLRTIRAIWARDPSFNHEEPETPPKHYPPQNYDNPFRMSLDAFDRHNIVHLSANNYIANFLPLPVNVRRLMLTSLGAWMNVRGAWEPPSMLSVEEWRHRGTMGRDHYVRVVYKGYLFPFGHRASLVKVTERKFHPQISSLLLTTMQYFVQKMDHEVQALKERSRPEISSVMRAINETFEKEIYGLIGSIEGKSQREINLLIKQSKEKFNEQTASIVKSTGDKWGNEFASLAQSAKDEYQVNVDSVIKVITARSYPDVPGNIAYLRQRMYIVVREPERIFVNNTGLRNGNNHAYDLQFPFWNVQITTLVTPNLDKPEDSDIDGKGQSLFWPMVDGQDFQFQLIVKDFAENEVEFTAPLVFIEQTTMNYLDSQGNPIPNKYSNEVKPLLENVQSQYVSKVEPDINGQSVMYADSAHDPGKTTLETKSMIFSAELPADENEIVIMKQNLGDPDIPPFYPIISKAKVLIPSIKHLAGNNETAEIEYDDTFLMYGFDGNYNKGEVFADLTSGLKLDFNSQGDRSGGLVKPNMDIRGLSRLMGPVAGSNLSDIAGGTFDPEDFFGALDAKIFGVIDLWDIIQMVQSSEFLGKTKNVPKLTADTTSDKLLVELKWEPELKDWNNLFIASNGSVDASLSIKGQLSVQSSGEAEVDITCELKNFSVDLIGNVESFIIIRFDDVTFKSKGGEKADVDVNIAGIEFVGVLAFVETLKDLIPLKGFSDPPSIDVTEQGIVAGYSLGLPDLAIGIFSLENLSLGASFTIPFTKDPLSVRFNFCDRHSPFLLTVSMFGGGGFFAITLDPKGVQVLEAAFEFGASISVSFGVASGGVYVLAGIYFKMEMDPDKAALTGYFRMGGEVDVMGIISVSIELYLSLMYEFSSGKCVGRATLTIEVEIIFFSVCVEISCEKKFAGSGGDPTFQQLMEPYTDPETGLEIKPWETYCQAFA
jgi:hypothetical protein